MQDTNVIITGSLLSEAIDTTLAAVRAAASAEQAETYRATLVDRLLIHERMLGTVHPVDAELPEVDAALLDA